MSRPYSIPKDLPKCPQTGKVAFSKREAQTRCNFLKKIGRERSLRVYACEHGNHFHLTHAQSDFYGKRKRK